MSGVEGDCLAQIEWNGKIYDAAEPGQAFESAGKLEDGSIPCPSGSGSIEVAALEGIDPAVGVITPVARQAESAGSTTWAGPGYLLISPKHPLHVEIGMDRDAGFDCGSERTMQVRVETTPLAADDYLVVRSDDPEDDALLAAEGRMRIVSLEPETTYEGIDRHGVPYVEDGDELELTYRICDGKKDEPGLVGLQLLVVSEVRGA